MSAQQNIISKKTTILALIFTLITPQILCASELQNPLYQSFDHTNSSSPDSSPKSTESNHSQKTSQLHNQSSHSLKDISYVLHESDEKPQNHQPISAEQAQTKSSLICPCFGRLFKTGLTICQ